MPYEGLMQTAFKKLTPEQQTAVYQYVLFLVNTPSVDVAIHEEHHPKRRLGMLSNRFRGISNDFNDVILFAKKKFSIIDQKGARRLYKIK